MQEGGESLLYPTTRRVMARRKTIAVEATVAVRSLAGRKRVLEQERDGVRAQRQARALRNLGRDSFKVSSGVSNVHSVECIKVASVPLRAIE